MKEDPFPFSARWIPQSLTDHVSLSESHGLSTQTPAGGKGVDGAALAPASFLVWWLFPLQSAEQWSRLARAPQPLGEVFSSLQSLPLQASTLQHYFPCPFWVYWLWEFLTVWLQAESLLQPVLGTSHPTLSYHLLQETQQLGTPFADRSATCPCRCRKV